MKSKEYILQCDEAVEIQREWKPKVLDRIFTKLQYVPNRDYIAYITSVSEWRIYLDIKIDFDITAKTSFIWLPRQDQLQRIIINLYQDNAEKNDYQIRYKREILNWVINSFDSFVKQNEGKPYKSNDSYPDNLESMEQLWLAFTMSELYHKKWNGKDWEKNV